VAPAAPSMTAPRRTARRGSWLGMGPPDLKIFNNYEQ
jgi:hypothetical protein